MAHQVVWAKCNVFAPDGTRTTLNRGQLLPDGVDDAQLGMLTTIGAVQVVEIYEPRQPVLATATDEQASDEPASDESTETLAKPSPDDTKEAWVAYATDAGNPKRITASEARALPKPALISRFTD